MNIKNGRFEYEYAGCTFSMQATTRQGHIVIYSYDPDMDWWDIWRMTDIDVPVQDLPTERAFLDSIANQASFMA